MLCSDEDDDDDLISSHLAQPNELGTQKQIITRTHKHHTTIQNDLLNFKGAPAKHHHN